MAMMRTLRAQGAAELRTLVEAEYRPGDRLPPESELARRIGLSRNTLREAIGLLAAEGLVERKWGVGTTVRDPHTPAVFSVTDVSPVRDVIRGAGHRGALKQCTIEPGTAEDRAATTLGLKPGSAVWIIERTFTIDDVPAILMQDVMAQTIAGTLLDPSPLEDFDVDMVGLIKDQTGQVLTRMEGKIDAIPAAVSSLMQGQDDDQGPLVQISQTCFTDDGTALVYTVAQFNTRIVDLTVKRSFSL
jgi:GntR family transcriptional regulator